MLYVVCGVWYMRLFWWVVGGMWCCGVIVLIVGDEHVQRLVVQAVVEAQTERQAPQPSRERYLVQALVVGPTERQALQPARQRHVVQALVETQTECQVLQPARQRRCVQAPMDDAPIGRLKCDGLSARGLVVYCYSEPFPL